MKKILCVAFFVLIFGLFSCTAREAAYSGNEYSFSVHYSDKVCPGDIVYLNISFYADDYDYKVPEKATAENNGGCGSAGLSLVPPPLGGTVSPSRGTLLLLPILAFLHPACRTHCATCWVLAEEESCLHLLV